MTKTTVHWIPIPMPGRLGTMARPRGGEWLEAEMQHLRQAGVDMVVSLLTYSEIAQLDLREEETFCQNHALKFISFPIKDRDVPESITATSELVNRLKEALAEGKSIVIHCRAGIGRSSLIAASILVVCGMEVEESFSLIERCRGLVVPDTQEQRDWVASFARRHLTIP